MRVIESGREMAAGFDEEKKKRRVKRRASVFVNVEFELIFCHPCFWQRLTRGDDSPSFVVWAEINPWRLQS